MKKKFNMRCLVAILIIFSVWGCDNRPRVIKTGYEGKKMPTFNVLLMDSITTLKTSDIHVNKPIVLLYFDPLCPHCRLETKGIVRDLKSTNIEFYLFSNYPFNELKKFYKEFNIRTCPNITLGQDYDSSFSKYYNVSRIPYMAFYNKDKLLRVVLVGQVEAKTIREIALN
jgi:peroxiredoxin